MFVTKLFLHFMPKKHESKKMVLSSDISYLFMNQTVVQLLATDILVPATMKNAANCDT